MSLTLHFQDPQTPGSTQLELILQSSKDATYGGGIYSFASLQGSRMLFEDPAFAKFLREGSYQLVVGLDAITLPTVLEYLAKLEARYARFRAFAFLNRNRSPIFHPKMCWFRYSTTTRVIVGSGNLTEGGLRTNWEAFGSGVLEAAESTNFKEEWERWLETNSDRLIEPLDSRAVARAELNRYVPPPKADELEVATTEGSAETENEEVLIAEIPRASTRWAQANFDKATFMEFFEGLPGDHVRIILLPVSANGELGDPELRQSFSVKSQNYRIELGMAAGLAYPEDGRPIAVFVRVGTRQFRYRLFLPGDTAHTVVSRFLDASAPKAAIRRIRVRSNDLPPELDFVSGA